MERDEQKLEQIKTLIISTHTLTWSVTSMLSAQRSKKPISTHTLTWSVTCLCKLISNLAPISTHTLTWSVTTFGMPIPPSNLISTHTLTWSVTLSGTDEGRKLWDFNSHAHVERDGRAKSTAAKQKYFNSHAHVERDILLFAVHSRTAAFQLTRSRGA